jgi:putative transcriptional regulator
LVNKIAEIRKQQGYTQQGFAKELKISVDHLNRIERGRRDPSLKLAVRIAQKLNVKLDDLFF